MAENEPEMLLVEDNANDVELTLHALRRSNISNRVQVVRDGAEALDFLLCRGKYADRAGQADPKVILLDLKLPLVGGLEVLRQIKANARTRRIPVVVLTSSKEEPDIASAYDLGVNSYIVKPVDFDQFTESIRALGMYWLVLNQAPEG